MRPCTGAALVAAALAAAALPGSAGAVHQSYHGPFAGTTSQELRILIRVRSHARLGVRVRWRAKCEGGLIVRRTRFRNVPVGRAGRFTARHPSGVAVRGKIGFDPQGNPAFPEPFSFANNEAKGSVTAELDVPGRGRCSTGRVTWEARR